MRFGDAVIEMEFSKRLTRHEWDNRRIFIYLDKNRDIKIKEPGRNGTWIPTHEDLLAYDWVTVEI
jgi:hypothetical protein